MEYLKQSLSNIKFWLRIFLQIFPDILYKVLGNLFPLYIGALVLLIVDKTSIPKIFDAQAFFIYSSTFLFSSMYLWFNNTNGNNRNKTEVLFLLFFFLLGIILSILYAFTFVKTREEFDFQTWAFILFAISVLTYIIFECHNYYKTDNSDFAKSSREAFQLLREQFKNR
jgi:uncharacterized membrane protein